MSWTLLNIQTLYHFHYTPPNKQTESPLFASRNDVELSEYNIDSEYNVSTCHNARVWNLCDHKVPHEHKSCELDLQAPGRYLIF